MKYYLLLGMDITKQNGQDRFSQKKKKKTDGIACFSFLFYKGERMRNMLIKKKKEVVYCLFNK